MNDEVAFCARDFRVSIH